MSAQGVFEFKCCCCACTNVTEEMIDETLKLCSDNENSTVVTTAETQGILNILHPAHAFYSQTGIFTLSNNCIIFMSRQLHCTLTSQNAIKSR